MTEIKNIETLYPEITDVSLGEFFKERFASTEKAMVGLKQSGESQGWVSFSKGIRMSQVALGTEERAIIGSLWQAGVNLANAKSDSFDSIVEILVQWFDAELKASDLANQYRCVKAAQGVESYEEGPQSYVRFKWEKLVHADLADLDRNLDVIVLASKHPVLSQLFPYQSHSELLLSKYTGYPYSKDSPAIFHSGDIGYTVVGGGKEYTKLTATEAIDRVVELLPEDYVSAVHGAADEAEII